MKKILSLLLALVLVLSLVACGNNKNTKETKDEAKPAEKTESKDENKKPAEKASGAINVISREEGSGTRGAFVEIVKVLDKDKNDLTTPTAAMIGTTGGVIEAVAPDSKAIGYASLGSVEKNKDVKMLKVNSVEPTPETILSGKYPIQRPLNIAYREDKISDLAKDFVSFMMSKEGQDIAVKSGFVQADANAKPYEKKEFEGKIAVSGSTSVGPLMEKLAEAYKGLHPKVQIEINQHGSSAGMTDSIQGLNDIGMASRELKDDEKAKLAHKAIAKDGIALIVSPQNPVSEISMETIKGIYKGEITDWKDVK